MPTDAERWRFLADHKLTLHTDGGDYLTHWCRTVGPGQPPKFYPVSSGATADEAIDVAIDRGGFSGGSDEMTPSEALNTYANMLEERAIKRAFGPELVQQHLADVRTLAEKIRAARADHTSVTFIRADADLMHDIAAAIHTDLDAPESRALRPEHQHRARTVLNPIAGAIKQAAVDIEDGL